MGQLEKYGLYVLCLVIFLILGVALWGDPAEAQGGKPATPVAKLDAEAAPAPEPRQLSADSETLMKFLAPSTGNDGGGKDPKAADARKDGTKPPADDKPPAADGGKGAAKKAPESDAKPPTGRRTYTVKDGDVLSTIAQRELTSIRYVDDILALNPSIKDPRLLRRGDKLLLPSIEELQRGKAAERGKEPAPPAGKSGRTTKYTVVADDSFDRISRKLFKTPARADDIAALNPGLDPRKLQVGKDILVPAD